MATGNFHANFDKDLYNDFVSIIGKGNITKSFTEFMLNTIATHNQDTDGINIKLLNLEIDKLKRKQNKINSELQNKLQIKDKYELSQKEKEEIKLKEEKERIEATTKCINCGCFLDGNKKEHQFNNGKVCNSCFMSGSSDDVKRWNNASV